MRLNCFVSCVEDWEGSIGIDALLDKEQRDVFEIPKLEIDFDFSLSISTQTVVSESEGLLWLKFDWFMNINNMMIILYGSDLDSLP
jgi:hypothetical protein